MSEEKQQKIFAEMKFQASYSRDDSDPSYWLYVIRKPDGDVLDTIRFRLGEDFDSISVVGRPISVGVNLMVKFCRNFDVTKFQS